MIELKEDVEINDFLYLTPTMWVMWAGFVKYCSMKDLPIKVTSIFSDRKNVQSKSRTHEEFRAIDVSVDKWRMEDIQQCVAYMNSKFRFEAAISSSDFEPRAVVYHNYRGQGDHLHIQVRR